MKANAYCYAHCSRAKRRTCKQDCRKLDVEKDNIERSLADIETYYLVTRKAAMSADRRGMFDDAMKRDEMELGRDVLRIWLEALSRDDREIPPSWRIPGGEYRLWDPRVMFYSHWTDSTAYWDQDSKWFRENRDRAIEGGLDSMLDAYYSGVPYEDIVA